MKLILVAKSDLNDNPNHDGTITLGSEFKCHAIDPASPQTINRFIQKVLLQKQRIDKKIFPVNFYALAITEDVYQSLIKNNKQHKEILDIELPFNKYNLIGYIQARKNTQFKLILNNDFNDDAIVNNLINLTNNLHDHNNVIDIEKVDKANLGYCPIRLSKTTSGLYKAKKEEKFKAPESTHKPVKKR